MARIRTLKPDHGQHRKIGPLSNYAYRVWVCGLVTQADDEGRLIIDPEEIRVKVYGYHPTVTTEDVVEMVGEIIKRRLLHVYEHKGQIIGQLHDWADHQAVRNSSHFKASSLPCVPRSVIVPQLFRHYSVDTPQALRPPRKGKEGKGGEGKEPERGIDSAIQEFLQKTLYLKCLLNGKHGKYWKAMEETYDQYPFIYFEDEIKKADTWCVDHPEKRPTEREMAAFFKNWLERAVETGRKQHGKT